MRRIKGKEANKELGEHIFDDDEDVLVFSESDDELTRGYITSEDDELDGVYAVKLLYNNERYFSVTDGVETDTLVAEKYEYKYTDYEDILYISEDDFNTYFDKLDNQFEYAEIDRIEASDDSVYIVIKKHYDDDSVEYEQVYAKYVEEDEVYRFLLDSCKSDFSKNSVREEINDQINTTELRDIILEHAVDELYDYDAYELATQSSTTAEYLLIKTDNDKYVLFERFHVDGTGNSYWGGVYFKHFTVFDTLEEAKEYISKKFEVIE